MTVRGREVLPEERAKISATLIRKGEHCKGPRYLRNENGCWIWHRSTNGQGYPHNGQRRRLYENEYGTYPAKWPLHHHCGEKMCVRPAHAGPMPRKAHEALHRKLDSAGFKDISVSDRIALSVGLIKQGAFVVAEDCLA